MKDYKEEKFKEYNDGKPFGIYISGLGQYNEGALTGKWLYLPASKEEIVSAFKEAGIGKRDSFGIPYEEYFISDYDDYTDLSLVEVCGEYVDVEELNLLAQAIEDLDDDDYKILCAYCSENQPNNIAELYSAVVNIPDAEIYIYPDIDDYSDLGYYLVENVYGGIDSANLLNDFVDVEMLGRDEDIAFYAGEHYDEEEIQEFIKDGLIDDPEDLNAGFYWCGDLGASDSEIGEAILDELGVDGIQNIDEYFDYKEFGRFYDMNNTLSWQDGYVADIVDGIDFDDSLEKDIEELNKSGQTVCPSVQELTEMFDKEKGSKGKDLVDEAKDVARGNSDSPKRVWPVEER